VRFDNFGDPFDSDVRFKPTRTPPKTDRTSTTELPNPWKQYVLTKEPVKVGNRKKREAWNLFIKCQKFSRRIGEHVSYRFNREFFNT